MKKKQKEICLLRKLDVLTEDQGCLTQKYEYNHLLRTTSQWFASSWEDLMEGNKMPHLPCPNIQ